MSGDATWLGTKQAAERIGVTLRTLYCLIDQGQVPAYKFGRVIRLKEADVEAFIENARIEPGQIGYLYPKRSPKLPIKR